MLNHERRFRTWYETAEWVDFGHTLTYGSATTFTIITNVTGNYSVGRRIKAYGTTPFTLYGTITVSSYSAPSTTVTVVWDSGSLDSTLTQVWLGIIKGGTTGSSIDPTLAALAAYNTNGLVTQTAADTFTGRTLTGPAAGISVSNGNGVSGNPTLALANDLSALEAMSGTGLVARTGSETYAQRTITAGQNITIGNGDGVSANPSVALDTVLANGVYTPTLTNVANLDGSTARECQYLRVGSTVTVSGSVDINPTLTATTTRLGISLPVASNLGAGEDCAGVAFAPTIAGQGAAILGDSSNDRAQMEWIATDVTNQPMYFTFTYQII